MIIYYANCPVCFEPMVERPEGSRVFHCREPLHKDTFSFNPPQITTLSHHVHSWEALDARHDYDNGQLSITWTRQRCVECGVEDDNVLGPGEWIVFPVTDDEESP